MRLRIVQYAQSMSRPNVFRQTKSSIRTSGNRILFQKIRADLMISRLSPLPAASVSRPKVSRQSVKPTARPKIA